MFGVAQAFPRGRAPESAVFSGVLATDPPFRPENCSDNIIHVIPRFSGFSPCYSLIFVVILHGMYLRTIKVRSSNGMVNESVRVVEAYRQDGKVKQRTIADLGRKDFLAEILPKLQRLLGGNAASATPIAETPDPDILDASTWGPILVLRTLFDQLGLWSILDQYLGQAKGVPFADRVFVLVANRLIAPASEHGLAGWLETDFVCDRQGRRFIPHWHQRQRVRVHPRQLDAWYRTLHQLHAAKDRIEVALYRRLRDLFSLKPDLVLYDITRALPFLSARRVEKGRQALGHLTDLLDRPTDRLPRPIQVQDQARPQAVG